MRTFIIIVALLAALFIWDYALNDADLFAWLNAYVDEFSGHSPAGLGRGLSSRTCG